MITAWTPRPSDIAWMRTTLARLRNGGLWALPIDGSRYTVDHTRRVLCCTKPGDPELARRIHAVALLIGWSVEQAVESITTLESTVFGSGKTLNSMDSVTREIYLPDQRTSLDSHDVRLN